MFVVVFRQPTRVLRRDLWTGDVTKRYEVPGTKRFRVRQSRGTLFKTARSGGRVFTANNFRQTRVVNASDARAVILTVWKNELPKWPESERFFSDHIRSGVPSPLTIKRRSDRHIHYTTSVCTYVGVSVAVVLCVLDPNVGR